MTPDEMRRSAGGDDTTAYSPWGPAAEICERLDAIAAVLTYPQIQSEPVYIEGLEAEIEKLRVALRSVREQIDSGPDVSWSRVDETIARALGELE